jgi:hypothetical protein
VDSPDTAVKDDFQPGFRLSVRDVVVIVLGIAAASYLWTIEPWWGFIVAFVIAHFFLFCNVVRMARPLELTWTAVFLAFASATLLTEAPGWPITTAVSLAVTFVVVALQLRRPSYHGIGWQRINPSLRAWWDAWKAEG